jgi:hypothetical protein
MGLDLMAVLLRFGRGFGKQEDSTDLISVSKEA